MAIDATIGMTGLVEAMCLAVARSSDPFGLTGPVVRLVCISFCIIKTFIGHLSKRGNNDREIILASDSC